MSSSRETALFSAPKVSRFNILLSEDDNEEVMNENKAAEPMKTSTEPVESEKITTPAVPLASKADTDDWNFATTLKKNNKKTSGTGNHPRHVPNQNKKFTPPQPLAPEQLNAEQTLEIYDFPAIWRTSDIRKLFSSFDGHYRLKWQSDTSCWIHFDTAEYATRALSEVKLESASLRVFSSENVLPVTSKSEVHPNSQTTIQIFGFPSDWRAPDIMKLLQPFDGQYRLKWRNDYACYVIFESSEVMEKAKEELSKENQIKIRQYFDDQNHH